MAVSSKKNLRVCQVNHSSVDYDLIIAVADLDEVDGILQDWATDNLGEELDLPEDLVYCKDITEVITALDIDNFAYLQSTSTSYDTKVTNNLILPKTTGKGIKVDLTTPTFGYRRLIGNVITDTEGADAPTLTAYRGGNTRDWLYAVNKKADVRFNIPHDYVPGSDLYLYIDWSHNGTAISGNLVATFLHTYSKGFDQAIFPAEKTILISKSTPDVTTIPQYRHMTTEVQLSAASPSGSQIDSDDLEIGGIILANMEITTLPTITGGSAGVFIHGINIHYQSTNIATKDKEPDFYGAS